MYVRLGHGRDGRSVKRLIHPTKSVPYDCNQGTTAAATTLLKVMIDPSPPTAVRVRAAECVMTHSSKAIEIEDVEFHVSELERAAEAQKKP